MPRPPRWVRATRSFLEDTPLRPCVRRWYPRVDDTPLRTCPCLPRHWRARHDGRSTYKLVCLRCGQRFDRALYIPPGSVNTKDWINVPNSDVFVDRAGYFHARRRDYRTPPDSATAHVALAQEEPLRPWDSRATVRQPARKVSTRPPFTSTRHPQARRPSAPRPKPPPPAKPRRDSMTPEQKAVDDLLRVHRKPEKSKPTTDSVRRRRRRNAESPRVHVIADSSCSLSDEDFAPGR